MFKTEGPLPITKTIHDIHIMSEKGSSDPFIKIQNKIRYVILTSHDNTKKESLDSIEYDQFFI